jgi:hypothetical protein
MPEIMLATSVANRTPKTAQAIYFVLFLMGKRVFLLKLWSEKFP